MPLDLKVMVDWRVLLYTFALSVGSGLLFGIAPAWAAARPILASALKGEDMLARPGRRWTLRNVLAVAQIAMSLVLLAATGLFLRSLRSASAIDIGFRQRGVLMMSLDPRVHGYSAERTVQFLGQLRDRVAALPGVTSAACTDVAPLSGGNRSDGFSVEGRPVSVGLNVVDLYMARPGTSRPWASRGLRGATLRTRARRLPKVAVVNEAFVTQLFKNENPIGQRVSGGGVTYQVIGDCEEYQVADARREKRPVLYRSLAQSVASDPSFLGYTVVVRSEGDAGGLAGAVRREIRALDPTLAVFNVETMEEHLRDALFCRGWLAHYSGFSEAWIGTGGGRIVWRRELFGEPANAGDWNSHGTGRADGRCAAVDCAAGMVLTLIAVVLGLGAAFAVTKLFTTILYGIRPHDILTFTIVPVFLASVALLACWIPSRRAARVDPLTALRYE